MQNPMSGLVGIDRIEPMEWGEGIFQNGRDFLTLMNLDEEAGLKELVAKLGVKSPPPTDDSKDSLPNRFSIHADYNYGTGSIRMTRRWLDSGVLTELIETNMAKLNLNEDDATHALVILGASAMTLGCTLSNAFKEFLEKASATVEMSEVSKCQLNKALSTYTNGTAYNFGNLTLTEWMSGGRCAGAEVETFDSGWKKIIEVNNFGGVLATVGPPTPEEEGVEPTHSYDVCGQCGAETVNHGKENGKLMTCGKCNGRKYCTRRCQKKHWQKHRMVCRMLTKEIESAMPAIYQVALKLELASMAERLEKQKKSKAMEDETS